MTTLVPVIEGREGWGMASTALGPVLRPERVEDVLEAYALAQREGWRVAFYGGRSEVLPVLLANLIEPDNVYGMYQPDAISSFGLPVLRQRDADLVAAEQRAHNLDDG
jgi:hypothetical protein